MEFPAPLARGVLVSRYKRFFADVALDDGTEVTAHCPNPGAMLGGQNSRRNHVEYGHRISQACALGGP